MIVLRDLTPGDVVVSGGDSATFVASMPHPIWPQIALVVWKMADGSWSHDALDWRQDVGELIPDVDRSVALRTALLGAATA